MRHSFLIAALFGLVIPMMASCAPKAAGPGTDARASAASGASDPSSTLSISAAELKQMTAKMPQSIRRTILSKRPAFLKAIAAIMREPRIYTTLVDKQHALPDGYEPKDLVKLDAYGISVSRKSLEMRKAVMPEVLAMVKAARTDHTLLLFSSTYRSFADQRYVYGREVKLYGKAVADSESAVPGHSQHQMGTTVDFGCICNEFANTAAFTWLEKNAEKYGFSMTYPKGMEAVTGYRYEPWHWHYITRAGTFAQREFFENVQQYLLEFLNENQGMLVAHYSGTDLGPGWVSGRQS